MAPPTQRSATQGPGHADREISTDWQRPMQRLCIVTRVLPEQVVRIWPKSRHWLSDVHGWATAGNAKASIQRAVSTLASVLGHT
ncbi:MAG: hypothetical protein AB7L90_16185 [Hyphomicrobiaceae bacterium]